MTGRTDAAQNYQDLLVPALMEEWAPRIAAAAGIRRGARVLDVACGTGVLTRAAARLVAGTGSVTGVDLDPGMLAVAARLEPGLRWHRAAAGALPFPDDAFDAVVSRFGLMFFPNPVAALEEMMRVLVPGGRLVIAVWASLTDTPAYAAEVALVERMAGPAAAEALGAPFALGEVPRLIGLCRAAGIAGAEVRVEPGRGRFPSIRLMLEADLRGWLPLVGIVLHDQVIEDILREGEQVLRPFVVPGAGRIEFASPAVLAAARKPPRA